MGSAEEKQRDIHLGVRNVGGISRTEVSFSPGVTVLTGRNATNRTSLLRSIVAALGSDDVSLKGDADEGYVELSIDDETYTRTLTRSNGTVTTSGEPYLDDPETADLFAVLLESNEVRQSVTRGDDLRDLVMRPVDTEELQSEIRRLETEKRALDDEIETLAELEDELAGLRDERARLEDEIETTRAELTELEAEIEEGGAELEGAVEEESPLESKMEDLRRARTDLEELRYDVETEEQRLEALREERDELESERETYPDAFDEVEDIQSEIDELRARISEIRSVVSELGSVIQFNDDMLTDRDPALMAALSDDEDATPTEKLVSKEDVRCWSCGTEVEREQIDETLDRLRTFRRERLQRQRDLEEQIEELKAEKVEYEEQRRQREQVEQRLEAIRRELDEGEEVLAELREQRDRQAERVEDLRDEVEELERDEHGELLELYQSANDLEFELGKLETRRADVDEEVDRIESRVGELDERRERREVIGEQLAELRNRIRQIETDSVEAFNEHVASLLDLLEYDNLERIWIERVEAAGGGPDAEASFDLHVVRSTDEGVTYEDTVDHLSESEREVTGLVFGLAGYLVHDVADHVPFMLLDSVEAIDADRIATLVDYFAEYAAYLVVALLPEDAAALDEEYDRITDI